MKRLAPLTRAIRLYSSTGGVELVPADRGGVRPQGHDRRLDRQEQRPQRARDRFGYQSGPAQRQRDRGRGRQRDGLSRRAEGRRPDRTDQAGQEIRQRAGHHGRNLEHLARQSGTRLFRRLHRRARAALLGKLHLRPGGGPGGGDVPASAQPVSRQAHRDRRIRLAERRLQPAQRRSRPVRAGLGAAQLRRPRRGDRHGIQHRRGDRSALEILRGRRRPLLGHPQRRSRAEILLDRADREPGLLEARHHRRAGRHPDVAADPAAATTHPRCRR